VSVSAFLSVCLPACLPVFLSICLSIYVSILQSTETNGNKQTSVLFTKIGNRKSELGGNQISAIGSLFDAISNRKLITDNCWVDNCAHSDSPHVGYMIVQYKFTNNKGRIL
jgi:hypothetical protein